jgi:hypothetical protein
MSRLSLLELIETLQQDLYVAQSSGEVLFEEFTQPVHEQ